MRLSNRVCPAPLRTERDCVEDQSQRPHIPATPEFPTETPHSCASSLQSIERSLSPLDCHGTATPLSERSAALRAAAARSTNEPEFHRPPPANLFLCSLHVRSTCQSARSHSVNCAGTTPLSPARPVQPPSERSATVSKTSRSSPTSPQPPNSQPKRPIHAPATCNLSSAHSTLWTAAAWRGHSPNGARLSEPQQPDTTSEPEFRPPPPANLPLRIPEFQIMARAARTFL